MLRKPWRLALPALALIPSLNYHGGWSVVSVADLPDRVVAGQPVDLTFAVRQHGRDLLSNLKPAVEARGPSTVRASVTPAQSAGHYTARLTLPQTGDWTITINSGFNDNRITLLPIQATSANAQLPALPVSERGKRLFVAKGCATCHVHDDVKVAMVVKVGPDLSNMRFPAEYLAAYLADPVKAKPSSEGKMPNLELKQPEIAALVAFINLERQALR